MALCAAPAGAAPLHVRLTFDAAAIPPGIQQAAVDEAARLWAPYAVDVAAIDRAAAKTDPAGEPSVALLIVSDRHTGRKTGDLGQVRFGRDGTPEAVVTIFYRAVATLATSSDVMGVDPEQFAARVRDDAIGRAVGRVLAHELGHFLLRSPHHPSSGLMRPRFAAPALADPSDRPFALTDTDRARLEIVRRALYPAPAVADARVGDLPASKPTASLVH